MSNHKLKIPDKRPKLIMYLEHATNEWIKWNCYYYEKRKKLSYCQKRKKVELSIELVV